MTGPGWQIVAIALSALQAIAHVAPPLLHDDAGTGADAPDEPADAVTLAPGAYWGNLTPPDDAADWYALRGEPQAPSCYEARITHAGIAGATLALNPSLNLSTSQRVWPAFEARLALATPNPQGVWLGLGPADLVRRAGDAAAGAYRFELLRFERGDLGAGDAGTGADAGGTIEDALPAPRGCFGGTLDGTSGDLLDVFTFDADEGDVATLSLTNGVNRGTVLRLVSPSGDELGDVTPGDVTGMELNETGVWQIQMHHRAPTPGEYMVALSLDEAGPPEPPPCQPMCFHGGE